jgi:urate oxidase
MSEGSGAVLGPNRYGKAETRVVRVDRSGPAHRLVDLNVSVALSGDLTATHLTGDNANVLPTDTQKNTVYAFAADGVGAPEDFALRLARHFVDTQPAISEALVAVESYGWERLGPHSFRRTGPQSRTARVAHGPGGTVVVGGVRDLVVLNTTGSEFTGFAVDAWTTLAPAADRILATAVDARWRYAAPPDRDGDDWDALWERACDLLLEAFAGTYSRSLQETLYAMGARVVDGVPGVVEVRLSLPNRHHFLVDLAPFGLANPDAVYHAADRPYGLIEGTVLRAGTEPDPAPW